MSNVKKQRKPINQLKTIFLMALLCAMFVPGLKANAAVRQTGISKTNLTVSWDAVSEPLNYKIYIGTNYNDMKQWGGVLPTNQLSKTITGLQEGKEYRVEVRYDYQGYSEVRESSAGYISSAKTLPGKVTGINQEKWWHFILSVDVKWNQIDSATGYEYIIKDNKGKTVKTEVKKYNSPSASCSIKNTIIYTIQVRAYTELNNKTYWGEWSNTAYLFDQPHVSDKATPKVSKGKLIVKWPKVNGATGYDVFVSTKPRTGYKKVASVKANKTSATVSKFNKKKFSAKKKYYVYVSAKKKVGKTTYNSGRLYFWNTKDGSTQYF